MSFVNDVAPNTYKSDFSSVQSFANTSQFNTLVTGSGMAVSQAAGNLVITSGTTANSETLIRSLASWSGQFNLRYWTQLSQRIAQNNFYVELADVVGDGLPFVINSATSLTITFPITSPAHSWTSANVGQFVYLGVFAGVTSCIPGRYAVASVAAGGAVTFTVASFPASGSGTCTAYGYNYHHVLYTSTTATNANYDAQRRGWNTGDTTATINTTAAPGHLADIYVSGEEAIFADNLIASTATPAWTVRASRWGNIPFATEQLYLQIHVVNGTSAPATTTTWTLCNIIIENFAATPVFIESGQSLGVASTPVTISNTVPITANSAINVAQVGGTTAVTGGVAGTLGVGGVVLSTVPAAAIANATAQRFSFSGDQQLIVHQDGDPTNEWQATSGISALATNSSTVLKAAGGTGIRNYCRGLQLFNTSATVSTTVSILDGSTVIWTGYCPAITAALPLEPVVVSFSPPLKGTAATAMNIQCGTTSAALYYNVQGYQNN